MMDDFERLVEVCEHGNPIGWSCTGKSCKWKPGEIGTRPARPADPKQFRRGSFLFCRHEPIYEQLLQEQERWKKLQSAVETMRDEAAKIDSPSPAYANGMLDAYATVLVRMRYGL